VIKKPYLIQDMSDALQSVIPEIKKQDIWKAMKWR
jgi:hypothetical protein